MKRRLNPGGPPSKAEYSLSTDSAPVPRGKGEKNPDKGSEKEPEIMCLQTVGVSSQDGTTACLLHNEPASYVRQQG